MSRLFFILVACWATVAATAHAAPPFSKLGEPRPRIYRPGVLVLPDARPPRPVRPARTRPVRAAPAPKKQAATKEKPRVIIKATTQEISPPTRIGAPEEEIATLGLSLSVPLASKVLRFIHIQGSVQAMVPVVSDKDAFDATLTARRRPEAAVEADLAIDMNVGDFHFAVGVGHGLKRGLGLSVFALFSYRPSRDADRSDTGPDLRVIQKPPPTATKSAP